MCWKLCKPQCKHGVPLLPVQKSRKKERKKRFWTWWKKKIKTACNFEFMWNVSLVNKRHHITDTNEWQILQDFYHKSTAWTKTFVSIENVVVLITFFHVPFLCATIEIGKWVQIWDAFDWIDAQITTWDDILKRKRYQITECGFKFRK